MDIYDRYCEEYVKACHAKSRQVFFKVELLDHYENSLYEVIQDITTKNTGSITASMSNGTRRTCSITLVNIDNKYTPDENSTFWINRKFKVYVGIKFKRNTFWWTQGVFIAKSASQDGNSVTIEGTDKYSFFNSDLNQRFTTADFVIPDAKYFEDDYDGIKIYMKDVVNDILLQDLGNGYPIDPVKPNIASSFAETEIQYQMSLSGDGYYSAIFEEISDNYLVEYYYDRQGIFTITPNKSIEDYNQIESQWRFIKSSGEYNNLNASYDLANVTNTVTAFCNTANGNYFSYTFQNDDPKSPIRVSSIGVKTGDDIEIQNADSVQMCKERAEYELTKSSIVNTTYTFNCIYLPHLTEGGIIEIENEDMNVKSERFIITSIDMPLSVGEMTITVSKQSELPTLAYGTVEYTDTISNKLKGFDKAWAKGRNVLRDYKFSSFSETVTGTNVSGKNVSLDFTVRKACYADDWYLQITLDGTCGDNSGLKAGATDGLVEKDCFRYYPIFPSDTKGYMGNYTGSSSVLIPQWASEHIDLSGYKYILCKIVPVSGNVSISSAEAGGNIDVITNRVGLFGYQHNSNQSNCLSVDDIISNELYSSIGGNFIASNTDSADIRVSKAPSGRNFVRNLIEWSYTDKNYPSIKCGGIYQLGIGVFKNKIFNNFSFLLGIKLVKEGDLDEEYV